MELHTRDTVQLMKFMKFTGRKRTRWKSGAIESCTISHGENSIGFPRSPFFTEITILYNSVLWQDASFFYNGPMYIFVISVAYVERVDT